MKKFLNISLLTLVALSSFTLTSCLNEMEDIFDDDAVIRLNNARDEYFDILTKDGGKWKLEYFSNTGEPGYTYILTFKKDGMVTMSGHNKWINYIKSNSLNGSAFGSEDSMWELIFDNSLVLSFNTYNKYFHFFASPDKVPTGGASGDGIANTLGYGHRGDYEFNIMKYSNDTIYLTGKKNDLPMFLTKLPSDTPDESYLGAVAVWNKTLFSSSIPYVFLVLPDGKRWIIEGASTCNLRMYRENDDKISNSEYHNTIITHDGLAFMNPLTLDGYEFQWFARQDDGTLVSVTNPDIRIVGDDLENYLFYDYAKNNVLTWVADLDVSKTGIGGRYIDLVTKINTEVPNMKGYKKTSKLIDSRIYYSPDDNSFVFRLTVKKNTEASPEAYYFINPEIQANSQVKFEITGMNSYAQTIKNECPTIDELLNVLTTTTYKLTATSMLAPTTIQMTEVGSAENFFVWNIK